MAGATGRRVVCGGNAVERWKGHGENGCRYLILVQRVSPQDKLNPIRVSGNVVVAGAFSLSLSLSTSLSRRRQLWITFFILRLAKTPL